MSEIERAEEYALSFIKLYERQKRSGFRLPIIDADFIWEDKDFQEMVIQQISLKGYRISRINSDDGLTLELFDK